MKQKRKCRPPALLAAMLLLASAVMIFGGCDLFAPNTSRYYVPESSTCYVSMLSEQTEFESGVDAIHIELEYCLRPYNLDTQADRSLTISLRDNRLGKEIVCLEYFDQIRKEDYTIDVLYQLDRTMIRVDVSIPREYFHVEKGGMLIIGGRIGTDYPCPTLSLPYEKYNEQIVLLKEYSWGNIDKDLQAYRKYVNRYLPSIGLEEKDVVYN